MSIRIGPARRLGGLAEFGIGKEGGTAPARIVAMSSGIIRPIRRNDPFVSAPECGVKMTLGFRKIGAARSEGSVR